MICADEEMNSTTANTTFTKTCYILNSRDELIVTFPSKKNLHAHIIAIIISVILYFSTVFLNGVTFRAIWRSRLLKEKVSNFNVMVKSVIDLAIGILFIPLFITVLASEIGGNPSCLVFMISKKLGVLVYIYSATAMCTMNFERYLAVLHPLIHRTKVTKRSLLIYTFALCCHETILFGFAFVYVNIFRVILTIVAFLFIASTVVVYTRILFSCLKNRVPPANKMSVQPHSIVEKQKRRFQQDLEIAKTCFAVMICCLICLLPGLFSNIIDRLKIYDSFSAVLQRRWFALLFLSNSTMNPVIFFWRNKTLRTEGINLIKSLYSR